MSSSLRIQLIPTYDRIHLSHDSHTEFVDASMSSSEDAGTWIVAIAFIDLRIFKNNRFRSIRFHGEHFLKVSDECDHGHGFFRPTSHA